LSDSWANNTFSVFSSEANTYKVQVHGHYSMCLAVSDKIYGPYRMRHESVPCTGGTGFFKANDGHWYTSFFGDDSSAPRREKPGIIRVDFDKEGRVVVAKEQPNFILLKDTKSP
jgi:hypothetical protein